MTDGHVLNLKAKINQTHFNGSEPANRFPEAILETIRTVMTKSLPEQAMPNAKRKQPSADDRRLTRASTKAKNSRPPQHHGNRYGRSEAAREAVLKAADDLLAFSSPETGRAFLEARSASYRRQHQHPDEGE